MRNYRRIEFICTEEGIEFQRLQFEEYAGPVVQCKGGSSSKSYHQTDDDTVNTNTDNAEGDASLIGTGDGANLAARLSGIVDSDVAIEVQNHGISGEQLADALQPTGEAIKSISADITAAKNNVAAVTTGVRDTVDKVVEGVKPFAVPATIGLTVYAIAKLRSNNH